MFSKLLREIIAVLALVACVSVAAAPTTAQAQTREQLSTPGGKVVLGSFGFFLAATAVTLGGWVAAPAIAGFGMVAMGVGLVGLVAGIAMTNEENAARFREAERRSRESEARTRALSDPSMRTIENLRDATELLERLNSALVGANTSRHAATNPTGSASAPVSPQGAAGAGMAR